MGGGWLLASSPMTAASGGDALALRSCLSHPKEGWGAPDPAAAVIPVGPCGVLVHSTDPWTRIGFSAAGHGFGGQNPWMWIQCGCGGRSLAELFYSTLCLVTSL